MKVIILFSILSLSIFASEEFIHEPYKLIQHAKIHFFGEVVLTVEADKTNKLNNYVKSITIELNDKTFKVPEKALQKLGQVKLSSWQLSSESDWNGIPHIYLRTFKTIYSEDLTELKKTHLISFDKKGYKELSVSHKIKNSEEHKTLDKRKKESP